MEFTLTAASVPSGEVLLRSVENVAPGHIQFTTDSDQNGVLDKIWPEIGRVGPICAIWCNLCQQQQAPLIK